jgi:hypothetical protein
MFDENAFIELDTKCGELKMLKMYNSQLYFFQEYGFGTISAGDRSLINDSSGKPVSLGVGSKLGGYNYISMQVGCNDESKLFFSSQGIFFINSTNDGLYQYSGQSLSELFAKGNVKGALAANITYTLCGTSDFLWIKFSSGKVLVYNLKYNVFESFLTFNPATMLNINDTFYHTKYASKVSNSANGYVSFYEPYTDQNNIGKFEDNVGSNMQTVTIISNPEQNVNKKFVSGDMQTWSNQSTLGNFIHNLYSNAKTA